MSRFRWHALVFVIIVLCVAAMIPGALDWYLGKRVLCAALDAGRLGANQACMFFQWEKR